MKCPRIAYSKARSANSAANRGKLNRPTGAAICLFGPCSVPVIVPVMALLFSSRFADFARFFYTLCTSCIFPPPFTGIYRDGGVECTLGVHPFAETGEQLRLLWRTHPYPRPMKERM